MGINFDLEIGGAEKFHCVESRISAGQRCRRYHRDRLHFRWKNTFETFRGELASEIFGIPGKESGRRNQTKQNSRNQKSLTHKIALHYFKDQMCLYNIQAAGKKFKLAGKEHETVINAATIRRCSANYAATIRRRQRLWRDKRSGKYSAFFEKRGDSHNEYIPIFKSFPFLLTIDVICEHQSS